MTEALVVPGAWCQAYSCVLLIRQLPRVRSYSFDALLRCTVVRGGGGSKHRLGRRHAFLAFVVGARVSWCSGIQNPQRGKRPHFIFYFFTEVFQLELREQDKVAALW